MKNIDRIGNITQTSEKEFVSTSRVGEINIKYRTLVSLFGEAQLYTGKENEGGKVDAEWTLETPKGRATIYNYKDGKNYNGKEGIATSRITDWHIGGENDDVLPYVLLAIYKR